MYTIQQIQLLHTQKHLRALLLTLDATILLNALSENAKSAEQAVLFTTLHPQETRRCLLKKQHSPNAIVLAKVVQSTLVEVVVALLLRSAGINAAQRVAAIVSLTMSM